MFCRMCCIFVLTVICAARNLLFRFFTRPREVSAIFLFGLVLFGVTEFISYCVVLGFPPDSCNSLFESEVVHAKSRTGDMYYLSEAPVCPYGSEGKC